MKKVLFAIGSASIGGAEKICAHLIKKMEDEFSVHVALTNKWRASKTLYYPFQAMGVFGAIFGHYDIIHSHLFWAGLFIRLKKIWNPHFKWVHTVHYDDYEHLKISWLKKYLDHKFIYPAVDHLVCVSDSAAAQLPTYLPRQIILNSLIPAANYSAHQPTGRLELLAVSMLRKEKGIDRLLHLMSHMAKTKSNIHLTIVGGGPEQNDLQALAKTLQLDEYVTFTGVQNNLESYFKNSHIFILPSRSESFGLTLLEAMSYALPIIALDVGNIAKILRQGEFGYISKNTDNPQCLIEAIDKVATKLSDFQEKAKAGHRYWSQELAGNKMIDEYRKIYYQVPSQKSVVIIAPFVTHGVGGLQKQIKLQSKALFNAGYRIYILQRKDPQLKITDWPHCKFWQIPYSRKLPQRLNGALFVLLGLAVLAFKNKKFQVIHAHQLYSPTILGAFVKKIFKKKLFVKITAGGLLGEAQEIKKLPFFALRKLCFAEIDMAFAQTRVIQQELIENKLLPFSHTTIIPNSVDAPNQISSQQLEDEFRLLYTGRLSTEKCLPTVIEALKLVPTKKKICFTIIGEVFAERNPTADIKKSLLNMPNNCRVEFLAASPNLSSHYLNTHAFILASNSEGMSNSLLEAMSFALPCLVSDIPANTALIQDHKTGRIFPVNNTLRLTEVITEIMTDYSSAQKLGLNARAHILANHSLTKIADDIIRNYEATI